MSDLESELANFGRFFEPALLILVSLASGPKHGYAMMEDIEQLARSRLGPGTLYGALGRLEGEGLIEALPTVDRRRPYQLTGVGVNVLRYQLAQLNTFVAAGIDRLAT